MFLKGFDTFDAASTVAAICAAKREQRRHSQSGSGSAAKSSSSGSCGPTLSSETNIVPCQPSAAGLRSTTSSSGSYLQDVVPPLEVAQRCSSDGHAANRWAQSARAQGSSPAIPSVIREDGNLLSRDSAARARAMAQPVLAQVSGPRAERCPSSDSAKHSGKGLDLMRKIKSFFSQL